MSKNIQVIFNSYFVNDLKYSVNENVSFDNGTEEIEMSCNDIEYGINNESELYIRCNVVVNTVITKKDTNVNFRDIQFKYLAKLLVRNMTKEQDILNVLEKGAMNIALSHITDVIKNVSSIDERGIIIPQDFPFPNESLNKGFSIK